MDAPDFKKAQTVAENIVSEYSINEPLVPIYDIAEAKRLSVKVVPMPEKLKSVSAFFDPENKIIYVNEEDPPNRQTFTIAHELGHYVLGHDPKKYGLLLRFPELNGQEPEDY